MEPLIVCALPIAGNMRTNANTADALDKRAFRNIFINYLLDRFSGLCVRTARFAVGGSGAEASENTIRLVSNSIWGADRYECSEKRTLTTAKFLDFSLYSKYKLVGSNTSPRKPGYIRLTHRASSYSTHKLL